MKTIDIRLKSDEVSMLRSMIGKELSAYMHDEFIYTSSSSQVVEVVVDDKPFFIYSFTEELDYFGTSEDVAVWTISCEKYPVVDKKKFVKIPVFDTIKGITLIQENQRVFSGEDQTYNVWLTRGIVFDLGERQVAFEKDIWFSEEIIVHCGYELSSLFSTADRFGKDWDSSLRPECTRFEEKIISGK